MANYRFKLPEPPPVPQYSPEYAMIALAERIEALVALLERIEPKQERQARATEKLARMP